MHSTTCDPSYPLWCLSQCTYLCTLEARSALVISTWDARDSLSVMPVSKKTTPEDSKSSLSTCVWSTTLIPATYIIQYSWLCGSSNSLGVCNTSTSPCGGVSWSLAAAGHGFDSPYESREWNGVTPAHKIRPGRSSRRGDAQQQMCRTLLVSWKCYLRLHTCKCAQIRVMLTVLNKKVFGLCSDWILRKIHDEYILKPALDPLDVWDWEISAKKRKNPSSASSWGDGLFE